MGNDPKQCNAETQHDRFKELARELGCENDPAAFEDALKKLVQGKAPKHEPKKRKPKGADILRARPPSCVTSFLRLWATRRRKAGYGCPEVGTRIYLVPSSDSWPRVACVIIP